MAEHLHPFKPVAYYNKELDRLTIMLEDARCVEDYQEPNLVILRSRDGKRVVGVGIEGVSILMEDAAAFRWKS